MNEQEKIIYEQRRELMQQETISEMVKELTNEVIEQTMHFLCSY